MGESIINQVIEQLQELPENLQRQVLNYVETLKTSPEQESQGKQLLQFRRAIPTDDIKRMQQAIDQECENIDANEW
jgi:mRNA-degrading endonuclease RelE of RelBE toxin-antitoxin system